MDNKYIPLVRVMLRSFDGLISRGEVITESEVSTLSINSSFNGRCAEVERAASRARPVTAHIASNDTAKGSRTHSTLGFQPSHVCEA